MHVLWTDYDVMKSPVEDLSWVARFGKGDDQGAMQVFVSIGGMGCGCDTRIVQDGSRSQQAGGINAYLAGVAG